MTSTIALEQERNQATDSIIDSIVSGVGDKTDTDPLELPPLYAAVDGDALEALCDPSRTSTALTVEFTYADCSVTISVDEFVEINVEEL